MNVKIKRLHPAAVIPQYAHDYDAGVDLVATEDVIVEPGATVKVPTGIAISLPAGYEAQVRPRSGITLKTKLRVALGTIDAGYVGEIGVIVDNIAAPDYGLSLVDGVVDIYAREGEAYDVKDEVVSEIGYGEVIHNSYLIRKGDRIAQLIIAPVEQATFIEVDTLEETQRGSGGFGSSGVKASYDKAVKANGGAFEKLSKEAE